MEARRRRFLLGAAAVPPLDSRRRPCQNVAAAARTAPSTPRLVSAARVGPVVYGLLLTFRGGGYG